MEPLTSKIKTQSPVCLYLVFFCGRENLETGLSKKIVVFTQQIYYLSIRLAEAPMKTFSTKQLLHNCCQNQRKAAEMEAISL